MKMNIASPLGLGTLPSNIITNSKEDLKGITTQSETAYQGPTIPTTSSSLPPVVECESEATKDMVHPANNRSTKDIQPSVVQTESPILNSELVVALIIEPVASLFGLSIKSFLSNKDKLCELARTPLNEHYLAVLLKKLPEKLGDPVKFLILCDFHRMAECLALADLGPSINLMPLSVWNKISLPDLSPTYFDADPRVPLILGKSFLKTGRALIDMFKGELTLFVGKKAITFNLDKTSRYSANYNDMTANRIDIIDMACEEYLQEVLSFSNVIASGNPTTYYDPIVSTISLTLTPFRNTKSSKSSTDEPPEVEQKDLPPHPEYVFLEGDDKFLVIIAKDLSVEEKTALITVLKSIAWKLSDIKSIDPEFCTHKILIEEDFEPARCMMAIFHDMIEKTMEVFMDDFSVFGNSFQTCLSHLEKMLKRCEDIYLCLNWEKSYFMVKEGIVLGHKIFKNRIEVDKAKVDVIAKLPRPTTVKGIQSFLDHVSFYRRFIQDFLKIARLMTHLLEKHTQFLFSKECVEAFQTLKRKLTEAPILIALDWDIPFEFLCDAMTEAESNYTTTEKEMLAVVYAFEKFQSYLIMNKSIVYTDHSALKYLFAKKDSKARLLCWVLLLQEFTFKVIDTKGTKNLAADRLC
nr:reverse transcriptase domain-containing protein [Tanacetum cinerariifolium]